MHRAGIRIGQGYLILTAGFQFCAVRLKTGAPFFDGSYLLFQIVHTRRGRRVVFVRFIQLL